MAGILKVELCSQRPSESAL